MRISVLVCATCGSDLCWTGRACCEKPYVAGTIEVLACVRRNPENDIQCGRPKKMHPCGWGHAFARFDAKSKGGRPGIGPRLQVLVAQSVMDRLNKIASEQGVSRTDLARMLIEHGLKCNQAFREWMKKNERKRT